MDGILKFTLPHPNIIVIDYTPKRKKNFYYILNFLWKWVFFEEEKADPSSPQILFNPFHLIIEEAHIRIILQTLDKVKNLIYQVCQSRLPYWKGIWNCKHSCFNELDYDELHFIQFFQACQVQDEGLPVLLDFGILRLRSQVKIGINIYFQLSSLITKCFLLNIINRCLINCCTSFLSNNL